MGFLELLYCLAAQRERPGAVGRDTAGAWTWSQRGWSRDCVHWICLGMRMGEKWGQRVCVCRGQSVLCPSLGSSRVEGPKTSKRAFIRGVDREFFLTSCKTSKK